MTQNHYTFIDQHNLQHFLAKLLFVQIHLMSSQKQTKLQDEKYRRSHRTIKKTDRLPAMRQYAGHTRRKIGFTKISLTEHTHKTCQFHHRLMNTDMQRSLDQTIQEMDSAFSLQRQKLKTFFKINLKLSPNEPPEPTQNKFDAIEWKDYSTVKELPQKYQIQREECFHPHSVQESPYQWSQESHTNNNKLQRRESMCLFSDNYQRNELVYSVETLVPRILRDDADPLLIGHIY